MFKSIQRADFSLAVIQAIIFLVFVPFPKHLENLSSQSSQSSRKKSNRQINVEKTRLCRLPANKTSQVLFAVAVVMCDVILRHHE